MLNRSGDLRGINGRAGKRDANGRFMSEKERDNSEGRWFAPCKCPAGSAGRACNHPRVLPPKVPRFGRAPPAQETIAAAGLEANVPIVLPMPLENAPQSPIVHMFDIPIRAEPRPLNIEAGAFQEEQAVDSRVDVLQMASSKSGISLDYTISYTDLIRPDVFQALLKNPVMTDKALKRKCFYASNLVMQLNKDIRDLGHCFPYVVETNHKLPMLAKSWVDASSGLVTSVVGNDQVDLHGKLASILVSRGLVDGTVELCTEDMKTYTTEPFYTLACFRNNSLVGIAVFRCSVLNNRERMIQLDLLATKLNEPPGVGTTLMKILRGLSQVSPLHHGFIAAQALRTASARRFYARKLPDCNSPLARSLLLSLACADPTNYLAPHLDLRASVVFPSGSYI